jgi:predicted DsbA family dithiol-disulfide isomerase
MQELQIDLVSDVACPWCAIGYRRLELAMEELEPELAVRVRWRAFQLNPDMPAEGEPILEHLTRKYGRSPEEMQAAQEQIIGFAEELGLNFSGARERWACNTFDAHRLLAWAREQGRQTELAMSLFDAYFGHARDMSDHTVLLQAAEAAGLPADEAGKVLESDRYTEEVRTEERQYKQAGVSGVPAFVVNGHYMISGAQDPGTLVRALRQIAAKVEHKA